MSIGAVDEVPDEEDAPEETAPEPAAAGEAAPGSLPIAANGAYPDVPSFELETPPPRPAPTGNAEADIAALAAWGDALGQHHAKLVEHQGALQKFRAGVEGVQAQKQQALLDERERKATEMRMAQAADRERRQRAIDTAIDEKAKAAKDVEGFRWDKPLTGAQIASVLLGGIGAGLQNAAAAQVGQVGHAQNEGLNTINRLMELDYKGREKKLQLAGNSLLEARYGFKESRENARAAMNDLDADYAAKWKAIGAEAAAQIKRMGGTEADVKASLIVAEANQKIAEAAARIHERQEQRNIQRGHNKATEDLARAHLGLQRETAENTRQARADAAEDKKAKADEKSAERDEARTVRDPNTGAPLGLAPTAKTVDKLGENLGFLEAYQDKAEEFAKHIERYGQLLNPFSKEYKDRQSIGADLQAIGRKVKGIQASDAGQKLEHMVVGGTGTGIERAADPDQVRRLAADARSQTEKRLRATLAPLKGETASHTPEKPTKKAPAPEKAPPPEDIAVMKAAQAKGDKRFDSILARWGK